MFGLKRVIWKSLEKSTARVHVRFVSKVVLSKYMPFVSKRIPIENKVANFLKMHTTPASFDPSTRRPRDSYVEDFLRFGSDQSTLEDYKNMTGTGIRMGKILEDMDVLAAIVAFAHSTTEENKHILQVVTATLDRIDLIQPLPVDRDIKLSGFTTYVGSSSMEVTLTMECLTEPAPKPGQESFGYDASLKKTHGEVILRAKFIMVAIDKTTVTPMKIAPLRLETEEDYSLYDKGAVNKSRKKTLSERAKSPPNVEEMYIVHGLHLEAKKYSDHLEPMPENTIWIKDTVQKTLILTTPQDRNMYNKIFGGFLMRNAYELASAVALLVSKSKIRFLAIDDISFKKPVSIGSILSMKAQVIYSTYEPNKGTTFQISVVANVLNHKTGETETTNEFYFTFFSPVEFKVLPQSYAESIAFIEGKRRQEKNAHSL